MIKGYCRTNLDGYEHVIWPEEFIVVPRLGDYVEGELGGERRRLQVVRVTHLFVHEFAGSSAHRVPGIEVELHK
jgi:hypothetical protein